MVSTFPRLWWKPGYEHAHQVEPPQTKLNTLTAAECYEKLKGFLAIKGEVMPPAAGRFPPVHRHLFYKNGFHREVKWMPRLEEGWGRLTYGEFCAWYGICRPPERWERTEKLSLLPMKPDPPATRIVRVVVYAILFGIFAWAMLSMAALPFVNR